MTAFKPMLAAKKCSEYHFPLLASPKLDGIRCLVVNSVVVGRSLKPIPNRHVQWLFGRPQFDGLDGELIVGSPTAKDCFHRTSSGVMSMDGEPQVMFHTFDAWHLRDRPFIERLQFVITHRHEGYCEPVVQTEVKTEAEINALLNHYIGEGFEGLMLRRPDSPYKYGRSTPKEAYLVKIKPFEDNEAEIVGVVELFRNMNEATTNLLGQTERSSAKSGKVAGNVLGALVVRDIKTGVQFEIGSGFTAQQRQDMWRSDIVGKIIKYRSQPSGVKDKPRFPVFLGFRDAVDMSE